MNDNLREQNKVLQQEATLKNAQALKTIIESDIKGLDLKVAKRTMEDIISKIQSESSSAYNKAQLTWQQISQNRFSDAENDLIKKHNLKSILSGTGT